MGEIILTDHLHLTHVAHWFEGGEVIHVREVDWGEARRLLQENGFVSYFSDFGAASAASILLGIEVQVGKALPLVFPGHRLLVLEYYGKRPKKPVKKLPQPWWVIWRYVEVSEAKGWFEQQRRAEVQ